MQSQPSECCQFCEAPAVHVRTIPASEGCLGVVETTFACDTMLSRSLTDGVPNPGGQLSALCESRQRLFDDVLARTWSESSEDGADWACKEIEPAMRRARQAVACRYPLPAKGPSDAKPD